MARKTLSFPCHFLSFGGGEHGDSFCVRSRAPTKPALWERGATADKSNGCNSNRASRRVATTSPCYLLCSSRNAKSNLKKRFAYTNRQTVEKVGLPQAKKIKMINVGCGGFRRTAITIGKPQGKHRVFLAVACFLRNRSLQYHRTATKTISQNIPSFFAVCQRADSLSTRSKTAFRRFFYCLAI